MWAGLSLVRVSGGTEKEKEGGGGGWAELGVFSLFLFCFVLLVPYGVLRTKYWHSSSFGVKKAEGEERSSEEGCKRKSPSATEQREKEKKEGTRSPFHATCLLLPTPYLVVVVLPGTPHVRNTLVARSTCTSSPPLLPRTTVLRTTIVVLLPSLTLPTASTASHPLPFLKLYLNHPAPHRTHFHPLRLASSP